MSNCNFCGNKVTSDQVTDRKSAWKGFIHFVCFDELERRDKELICKACGEVKIKHIGRCAECRESQVKYTLKEFYAPLP